MNNFKKPLMSFLVVFHSFLPNLVAAQNFVPCSGSTCSSCHFVQMANSVIVYLIGMMFVIFAVMMVSAGFGMITSGGSPDAHKAAKQKLTNTVIGLLIVLVGWILVDTVMRGLLKGGTGTIDGFGPWSEVKCDAQSTPRIETAIDEPETSSVVSGSPTPTGNAAVAGNGLSQSAAEADLAASGVGVKPGAGLSGVKPHVIEEVKKLNQACNCNITITEGTGGTHSNKTDFTHAKGFKLDLRTNNNPTLIEYVKGNFESAGTWKDGTQLYYDSGSCGTYAVEKDHIDVVYKTGC